MFDRMYQFDGAATEPTTGAWSRRNWVCARGFELVHSSRVAGRPSALVTGLDASVLSDPAATSVADDFLVSVLREDWPAGREQCRVRVVHTVAGAGPLTAVITGPPVPLVIRLDHGERSIPHRFFPARVDLEIRRGGQAPGAMALPRFPLRAASSYTIVMAAAMTGAPDIQEWYEELEHAE